MFKWLKKPDHPMANLKQAKHLLSQLPPDNPFQAIEELSEWLESVMRAKNLRLDGRVNAYKLLDETSLQFQKKLSRDYFSVVAINQFQENRLWTVLYRFLKDIADAYVSCVEGYRSGEKGINAVMDELPLLVCRTLHALEMQFKWAQLHYGSLDTSVWKTLYRTFLFAERHGFSKQQIALYPASNATTSVEQEFLKILMLWCSSPDNLLPLQFEIAERITSHFSRHFTLQPPQNGGQSKLAHYADLASSRPPSRLTGPLPVSTPGPRFFSPGKALELLSELITEVEQRGAVPQQIHLGAPYPADQVVAVLKHLERHWSLRPPVRASERIKASIELSVLKTFSATLLSLGGAESQSEKWVSQNVSEGGYDAVMVRAQPDWVQIGSLLVMLAEGSSDWQLTTVRRLNRDPELKWHVGIQILAKKLTPIVLRQQSATGIAGLSAVLVACDETGSEARILIKDGEFSPRMSFETELESGTAKLVPIEQLGRGFDFSLWRFRIQAA